MVSTRSRRRVIRHRWQRFGRVVGTGLSTLNRFRNGGTRTRSVTQTNSNPPPITGESDWRQVYRRKPMPRRRRNRWKRFSRKVSHVIGKQLAPKFNVFTRPTRFVSSPNEQAVISNHTVMGGFGNLTSNDLSQLYALMQSLGPNETIPAGGNLSSSRQLKLQVTGWMIETQITNNLSTPCYIDMYYWRTKKDVNLALADINAVWIDSLDTLATDTTGALMSITDYGVTPYQGVDFAKHITIYKKIRVKLAGGSTTQVEQRSGRNYYRDAAYDEHYSLLRNCTEGILFVQYGTPGFTPPAGGVGDAAIARATDISYSTNINYTWRHMSVARTTGGHRADT